MPIYADLSKGIGTPSSKLGTHAREHQWSSYKNERLRQAQDQLKMAKNQVKAKHAAMTRARKFAMHVPRQFAEGKIDLTAD